MGTRIRLAFSSLGARLLASLLLGVALVLSVHAALDLRSMERRYLDFVSGEANRSSGLIRRATHDGMLLNRLDDVQTTIERLADGPDVAAIRVYDRQGTVVLSSDRREVGETLPLEAAPCAACHSGAPGAIPHEASGRATVGDTDVVRQLSVIDNEPECSSSGCHRNASLVSVLGVLDVEMSMLPLEAAVADARRQLLRTIVVLMVVLALVATVVTRRFVEQPIRRLQEGTRRIASGDLSTRIEVNGAHEFARLARDFNGMAEDLEEANQALTNWSQTLEEKVAEKSQELHAAQRQVLHMEKMASLGKLSATVAHEINNPIAGVLTYARLVERELAQQSLPVDVREELERYLRLMQRECGRCGEIVQNLLVFARRTGSAMTRVDVNDIVRRSLMLVRHHCEIGNVTIEARYLERDPEMVADPGQLEQALVALFVNAAEAMREGGTLSVVLGGDEEWVVVEVTDTGVGIPPEVVPLIFEPFFSTKSSESGVGLGLAVVYGIVHRHGGTINVDSEVGRGTTFRVRLRRVSAEENETVLGDGRGTPAFVGPGNEEAS